MPASCSYHYSPTNLAIPAALVVGLQNTTIPTPLTAPPAQPVPTAQALSRCNSMQHQQGHLLQFTEPLNPPRSTATWSTQPTTTLCQHLRQPLYLAATWSTPATGTCCPLKRCSARKSWSMLAWPTPTTATWDMLQPLPTPQSSMGGAEPGRSLNLQMLQAALADGLSKRSFRPGMAAEEEEELRRAGWATAGGKTTAAVPARVS